MHRDHISIFVSLIVAIAVGLCLPAGCDEAPPEPSKPKMVQKRIIVPPREILNGQPKPAGSPAEPPRKMETNAETADARPAAMAELQPSEKPADSVPGTAKSEPQKPTAQPTEPVAPPGVQPLETSAQTAGPASDQAVRKPDVQGVPAKTAPDKAPPVQSAAGSLLAKALAPQQFYHAQGKIDPFTPLIKNEAPEPQTPKKKKIRRAPLTPLEKMALNQLTLVAVIHSANNDRSIAMVEEASGKGYIVKKGTFIGMNSGRVINIDTDRIIIREEVENVIGQVKVRETELKLQKAPGEF